MLVLSREITAGKIKNVYYSKSRYDCFKEKIDIQKPPFLPRIEYNTDSLQKTSIDNWGHGNFTRPPLVSIEVNRAETYKNMVVNGLGWMLFYQT